jgi:D-sedoheptulose 7-phosphate isomerase
VKNTYNFGSKRVELKDVIINLLMITDRILESIQLKQQILEDVQLIESIKQISDCIHHAFSIGNKLLLCGNGGSAADAQHLAAEFSGRFYQDRPPLFAEALHVNTSYLTAVANDYGFDHVYSRLVEAKGVKGDALIGLSTSGESINSIRAFEKAQEMGVTTIAFTGKKGNKLAELADHSFCVPSTDTPRIQEVHIMIGHIICEYVESAVFTK